MTRPAGQRFPGEHPDPTQIALLAEDAPAPVEDATGRAGEVAVHVEACAECRQVLADVLAVRAALAALPPVPLPPSVAARLAETLAEAAEPAEPNRFARAQPRRRRPATWAAAAAAAVAVLVGGGVMVRGLTDGLGDNGTGRTASRAEPAATAARGGSVDSSGVGQVPGAATVTGPELPGLVRGLVRGLVAAEQRRQHPVMGASASPLAGQLEVAPNREPAVAACLAALGVQPARLLLAASRTFAGSPATILVLADNVDATVVDVRVVRPGCPAGASDLRYRLDRLPVG